MAVSKKKQEANRRWDKANYDQILVKFPKGTKDMIRGVMPRSINGYICNAVRAALEADGVAAAKLSDLTEE